jgi:uncharacterized protein (DUF302 family)
VVLTRSGSDHATTLARLLDALEHRGIRVFAQVDHAAAAHDVGLELGDEVVVVFGNPRLGTLLMQSDRRVGIELPLRMLVWADDEGALIGYEDPFELAEGYELAAQRETLATMSGLMATLAAEAAGSG